jgi:hypothetical protein
MNIVSQFTPHECKILRRMAEVFSTDDGRIRVTKLGEEFGMDRSTMADFVQKLRRLDIGVVEWSTNESIQVLAPILPLVHQIDNPPPVDHWKEWQIWFRSRRWSAPIIGSVLLAPIVVQWGQWIWQAICWLRGS